MVLPSTPQTLTVTSIEPLVTTPASVQFAPQLLPLGCCVGACAAPVPAAWAIDKPDLAAVSDAGATKLSVPVATRLSVTAFSAIWRANAAVDVRVSVTDTRHAPNGTAALFHGPGVEDDDFVWLYPYSNTVLPLHLDAPVLQWDHHGDFATAVKISLRYPETGTPVFEWSTIVPETYPPRSTLSGMPGSLNAISPAVWSAFEQSARGHDAQLSIQRLVAGVLRREVTRLVHIADGGLRGRVYYTQYARDVFGWPGPSQTTKLEPSGAAAPIDAFAASTADPVCHSVSADGTTFVSADQSWSRQGGVSAVEADGRLRWLADCPQYPGTSPDSEHRGLAWAALSPDGRYALQGDHFWGNTRDDAPIGTSGDNGTGDPYAIWQIRGASGPGAPTLLASTANTNWGLGDAAMMVPSFSPDGRRLVFIDGDGAGGAGWRKGLSIFDFNPLAHAFSNRSLLYSTWGSAGWASGGNVLQWPVFEADSRSVLFVQSTPADTCPTGAWVGSATRGNGNLAPSNEALPVATIWSVDSLRPGDPPPVRLDNLNLGEGEPALRRLVDADSSHQPSSLPTTAAGYRWVIFHSYRPYGNTQNSSGWPPMCLASQLWIAALDDTPSARADRSHPAFWVPGQLHSDVCFPAYSNEHAVWVNEPCKPAGRECGSASECCQPLSSETALECAIDDPTPPARAHCVPTQRTRCAAEGELCRTDADCCSRGAAACIGLRCAVPPGPSVYGAATFVRDFVAECGEQELPVWRFFDWQTVTPGDSTIVFAVVTADSAADLAASAPIYAATAKGAAALGFSERNGVDIDDMLRGAGQRSQAHLRVRAELLPSTDKTLAPELVAWRQSFDCVPSK